MLCTLPYVCYASITELFLKVFLIDNILASIASQAPEVKH